MENELIGLYECGEPDRVAIILETVLKRKYMQVSDIEVFVKNNCFGVRFNGDEDYTHAIRESLNQLLYDIYPPGKIEIKEGGYTFISTYHRFFDPHPKLYFPLFEY